MWDDKDNQYLEGLAGLWCVSLGFSESRLAEAATRQFADLPYSHTFAHRSTEPVIELSERLISIAPKPMARAFFLNSGSEAIDTAIKFAWYYNNGRGLPAKKKIISRLRGYHGVTVAGGSLTAIPLMQNDFDLPLDRMIQTETPNFYRFGNKGESEEQFATRLADSLGAGQVRRTDGGRRGDLRVRSNRQHVGLRHLRDQARHGDLCQAAVLRLSTNFGPDDLGQDL